MANAIVLVPPFVKIAYGPLLGPAMLVGAGRRVGHDVRLCDLNAAWIRERLPAGTASEPRQFIGDHDRPAALTRMHRDFLCELAFVEPRDTHAAIFNEAMRLAQGTFGAWVTEHLAHVSVVPDVVGMSVMYRDQVEPALAITSVARQQWPNALIVWGGAHVTALRDDVAVDARYNCAGLIDRFLFGYAERTWVDLLDTVAKRGRRPKEAARAGCGQWLSALDDGSVVPVFDDLSSYDPTRLTLPVQSSRGCTYGKCAYCTYPSIEGSPRDLSLNAIDSVIEQAIRLGAVVSFKDSLVDGNGLETVAERICGRTTWSACTKLDARLPERLERLAVSGLRTLEIGLETIDKRAQALIMKRQSEESFYKLLDAAASTKIGVVANYITGLPQNDPSEEERCKATVENALKNRAPELVSKLEHNKFELERLSPMAREPERYGLRITGRMPWSSVLRWESSARLTPLRKLR